MGEPGELELDVRAGDPDNLRRLKVRVHISEFDDLEGVKRVLGAQETRNDVADWTCQDWVVEALESLHEEGLLDDFEYAEGKDTLIDQYYHD